MISEEQLKKWEEKWLVCHCGMSYDEHDSETHSFTPMNEDEPDILLISEVRRFRDVEVGGLRKLKIKRGECKKLKKQAEQEANPAGIIMNKNCWSCGCTSHLSYCHCTHPMSHHVNGVCTDCVREGRSCINGVYREERK